MALLRIVTLNSTCAGLLLAACGDGDTDAAGTDPDNTSRVDIPAMGGNNALTDQELADIIAYARSVQK